MLSLPQTPSLPYFTSAASDHKSAPGPQVHLCRGAFPNPGHSHDLAPEAPEPIVTAGLCSLVLAPLSVAWPGL